MTRIPDAILDEIRARLPVSEIVGRRVKLRRQGAEYAGLSPFNAERSPSFTVNDRKRFWHCFSSGKHGDIFGFLMQTEGMTFAEAVESLAREAGVDLPGPARRGETEESRTAREARLDHMERERIAREAQRTADEEQDRSSRVESAGRIARECAPIAGTLAERYLIGRGIDPACFADCGDLRFHPRLWHSFSGKHFPALVAIVRDAGGQGIGIWRIYLGDGHKGRAPVPKNQQKLGLGDFRDKGGAVRLGGMADEIGLGEGIESSAAAREINGTGIPVWPGLSTGGISRFIVPAAVRRVVVFGDADLPKRNIKTGEVMPPAGWRAYAELAERYRGSPVEIAFEAPGVNTKADWVDVLRAVKGLPREA